jgi:hypothetical protein
MYIQYENDAWLAPTKFTFGDSIISVVPLNLRPAKDKLQDVIANKKNNPNRRIVVI